MKQDKSLDNQTVHIILLSVETQLRAGKPNGAINHKKGELISTINGLRQLQYVNSTDNLTFEQLSRQNQRHYQIAVNAINKARQRYAVAA